MNLTIQKRLLFAAMACLSMFGVAAFAAESPRPAMTGHVQDEHGAPLPNALAYIVAAGPRRGSSPLCPYDYPDCKKRAISDAKGNFRIESLDPTLDFCLRVMLPGYSSFTNSKLIPEAGPITVKLRHRDWPATPPARHVFGRIIGPDGNPVAGALLDVEGLKDKEVVHWGGFKADEMAITDANGEFHLASRQELKALYAVVSAPGLAKRWATLEPAKMGLLRMDRGVTVKGRVLFKG